MLKIGNDGSVSLTRGDTARLTVKIRNDTDGKDYEIQPGDTLYLTLKKSVTDAVPALQKVVKGINTFHIEPADTAALAFGRYQYDVQITTEDNDVYTVIGPLTFEILKEVTC